MKKSRTERRTEWESIVTQERERRRLLDFLGRRERLWLGAVFIAVGTIGLVRGVLGFQSGKAPFEVLGLNARGIAVNLTDYLALSVGFLAVGLVGVRIGIRKRRAQKGNSGDDDGAA